LELSKTRQAPSETNWRKILASGHSQFPVYQKHRDNVLGMVHIKALWAHAAFGLPMSLKNLLTPVLTVAVVGPTFVAE